MKGMTSKVTSKGQIVIPKALREKYGIRPSMEIRWIERERGILIVPESEDPILAAKGMLKGSGLLKAFLKEKKLNKQKEDEKFSGK